jgi:hypothetical protein
VLVAKGGGGKAVGEVLIGINPITGLRQGQQLRVMSDSLINPYKGIPHHPVVAPKRKHGDDGVACQCLTHQLVPHQGWDKCLCVDVLRTLRCRIILALVAGCVLRQGWQLAGLT